MSTQYKKSEQEIQAIDEDLGSQENKQVSRDFSARLWKAAVDEIAHRIQDQRDPIAKMAAKAQETDPDKQVYGKNMTTKILALAERLAAVSARAASLGERIAPLVAAEEAEALAQKQREEVAEQARKEAEAAEAQRQAQALAEEQAKAAAEAQAKAKAEAVARAAAEAKEKADAEAAAQAKAGEEHMAKLEAAAKAQTQAQQQAQEAAAAQAAEDVEKKSREEAQKLAASTETPAAAPMQPGVMKVTGGAEELQQMLARGASEEKLVVVDFSAPWCGPCRAIAPFLDQLALQHASHVSFAAVDCEATPANRALASEANIRAFPTFHFYVKNARVAELAGANRERIKALIAQYGPGASGSAPAPPAASTAPGDMVQKLVAALQVVKSSNSFDEFCAAGRTLITFVSNVLSHPDDAKYRRVRMSNPRFHNSLGSRPGGVTCMEAVGFHKRKEGNDDVLVMDHVSPELSQVKKMLEDAMLQVGGAQAPQPAAPSPAAGMGGLGGPGFSPAAIQQMLGSLGGAQGLPGVGGGMGSAGPTGLGGMNPAMLQQMMQNPQAMQAAQRMMQNPQMMQTMQQIMSGGGPPDMSAMSQMTQQMMSDPAMREAAMQMMQGLGGMGNPGGMAGMGGMGGMPDMGALAAMMGAGGVPQPSAATAPAAAAPPSASATAPAPAQNTNPATEQEMSEEEMIQLAIRRSMEDGNGQQ